MTVPATADGVLNIHYKRKTYSTFVALVPTEPVRLNCVNSRTGPYKGEVGETFFFSTNEPNETPYKELPYLDVARITGKYTLVPKYEMKDKYLPQTQEWEFVLRK